MPISMTKTQMSVMMPEARVSGRIETWYPHLVKEMEAAEINTKARIAAFMASTANETGELRAYVESAAYSVARAMQIFGLSQSKASELIAAGGEALFNWVYADANRAPSHRLGNIHPGDGWKYRGRGPNQLTGRGNYEMMEQKTGIPLVNNPDMLLDPAVGAKIAAMFWNINGCNTMVDDGSENGFLRAMKRLNGGLHDFTPHLQYWNAAKKALSTEEPGYIMSANGNMVNPDVRSGTIVKDSNKGLIAGGVGGTGVAALVIDKSIDLASKPQLDWRVVAIIVIGLVVVVAFAGGIYWFSKIRNKRIEMSDQGIV